MRVADFVIEYLKTKGINNFFTVSGGGSIFLCDALYRNKNVKYISCHHEQAVAFAAESYSRYSNKLGGAIVTTGPGGTNAITGVASCWIDSIPVVFISGQVFLNQTILGTNLRQLGVQEINIIDLVKPITKYAVMVEDEKKIKYHLDKSIYLSQENRPGPVWVDIPANIQNAKIDSKNFVEFNITKIKKTNYKIIKHSNLVNNVISLLIKSKKPLFLLGHGVKISNSQLMYKKIIQKFKIPFCVTWNASDIIESDNKYYMGRPGAFAERGTNFIVQNCDLIICIGTRLPFMVTGYNSKKFAKNAKIVMVDIDSNELNKANLRLNLKINSDAKNFGLKLEKKLVNKTLNFDNDWLKYCNFIRKKYPITLKEYVKQKNYVNSYYFIDVLSKKLSQGECIVTDMGLSFVGTHQAFNIKKNQKLYTNSGHAPMGWGLPAAIGAYFASKKNKKIICITGEGGLQMNIQELSTIMHHQIPVKIFIYNNGGYLTIKQTQQLGFNNRIMGADKKSGLSFPEYKDIAKAHKIKYFKISNHINISNKLEKILSSKKCVICELMIDPEQDQKPKAINRREAGKTIPTDFEDLYPFISRKELEENNFKFFKKNIL